MSDYDWLDTKASDLEVCRDMLRDGSHSFYAASLLLPAEYREPACALYAFCRLADDVIDDGPGDAASVNRLAQRLDKIYAGQPFDHPADRAMVEIADVYGMPRELLDALIEGFQWDIDDREYQTISSLRAYGARVAGSVGAMMAVLMGARSADVLARACDLGVAMQLTNIARDVGEDARNDRVYLPTEWLAEAGIERAQFLQRPEFSESLAQVIDRLLAEADRLYQRSRSGIAKLPVGCRPGIYAAMRIYREIGVRLKAAGLDSVNRRTVVPKSRKSYLLGHALLSTLTPKTLDRSSALTETQFLVDAVVKAPAPPPAHTRWFVTSDA